jgi:hypothetical protein
MAINTYNGDKNIVINAVMKEYVASNKNIKYLGKLLGSRKRSKTNFLESTSAESF